MQRYTTKYQYLQEKIVFILPSHIPNTLHSKKQAFYSLLSCIGDAYLTSYELIN
jgi:hypothetical protein